MAPFEIFTDAEEQKFICVLAAIVAFVVGVGLGFFALGGLS